MIEHHKRFYHVSGGKAYGPSEPDETLDAYRDRVRQAYGTLQGVQFGRKVDLHPCYFW